MTRLERELATAQAMLRLYCRHHHGSTTLCPRCADLATYLEERLRRCPHLPPKPSCGRCLIHCFKPERRQEIRAVMRFAGPRMLWHHPWLALLHLLDERRGSGKRPRLSPGDPGSPGPSGPAL
jgi:hypothetical protein